VDLLLWRHAEAVDGTPDFDRPLTERGQKHAKEIAEWLSKHSPKKLKVLVSPTLRTQQTAQAFCQQFSIIPELAPDGQLAHLLAAIGWPDQPGAVLLVGHQPNLGQLASLLLAGQEANWTIKKGALWWFSNRVRNHETQTVLRTVMTPGLT
jgi:phosphohistidine phosphatase